MTKVLILSLSILLLSCNNSNNSTESVEPIKVKTETKATPDFNADSAYVFTEAQVAMGSRVPNTEAHKKCANYLASSLERFGAQVFKQEATLTAYDGTRLEAVNIIGSFNPESKNRILLCSHWDTRPFSDHDADPNNYRKPLDGADDGASGTGILLEIARQLGEKQSLNVGVDIIFFDAEDYGIPVFDRNQYNTVDDSYCLGSMFWAKNPHTPGYKAKFGILLDMVGAKNATFYVEGISKKYAARYVEDIWSTARELGYGKYFIKSSGGYITDDHEQVIKRGIPCVDIINYDPNSDSGFGDHWHTQNDNMSNISKETLKAVGETVLQVVYNN
jgi:hypothetical protein